MASAGFLFVNANGEDIQGGSTVESLERVDSIEVIELKHDVSLVTEAGVGVHRRHNALYVLARVDRALPSMYQAWKENQVCEVRIRFFRPSREGTGEEVEYFNILLRNGRVNSVKLRFPNRVEPTTAALPDQVEYGFVYEAITWNHMVGNRECHDSWSAQTF
ncbi:MAG: type VI secretion system tube protein Hcp [Rhodothermia bacterium]|nr:type VI secretion system tube protein Hcp [Rhodothermia bacterium]